MIIQTKNWREACQTVAVDFANETMELFKRRIVSCGGYLPDKKSESQRGELLDMFIDCMTGSVCELVASYTNDVSRDMQKRIVAKFERQFQMLRMRALGDKPDDEAQVEIVPDEVH